MRRESRNTIILVAVLATFALNGLGYFAFVQRREHLPLAGAPPTTVQPAPVASRPPVMAEQGESENSGLARAHRAAGLAALEQGRLEPAMAEFQSAQKLMPDAPGDLPELLHIASEMVNQRSPSGAKKSEPGAGTEKMPEKVKERERPKLRQIARDADSGSKRSGTRVLAKAQTPTSGGGAETQELKTALLLVTSVPSGLVVSVDGRASDITPSRIAVEPGRHTVEWLRGDRRLLIRSIAVAAGEVTSVDGDTTANAPLLAVAAPERGRAPEPGEEPAGHGDPPADPNPAANSAIKSASVGSSAPDPLGAGTSPGPARGGGAAVTGHGEVYVTSPDVYGEVWVNGRAYGYPPVIVRDLPAGAASVQIRSNGTVRRTENIRIEPSRRTSLLIH